MNDTTTTTTTAAQISTGTGMPWPCGRSPMRYVLIAAAKPIAATQNNPVAVTSNQSGRGASPWACCRRLRCHVRHNSHADTASASSMLATGPIASSSPPPSIRKNESVMGCVLPEATRNAARSDISPPVRPA